MAKKKETRAKAKPGDKRLSNQFWKNRTKHGRNKLFSSPDVLWEAAQEYFEWCDENPLNELDYRGKDAIPVVLPKMRAYTWEGLELYLGISSLREYKTNPDYKDFSQVITRIGKIIYAHKFEGAAAGMLNPNIIARDLSLVDKKEHNINDDRSHVDELFPPEEDIVNKPNKKEKDK